MYEISSLIGFLILNDTICLLFWCLIPLLFAVVIVTFKWDTKKHCLPQNNPVLIHGAVSTDNYLNKNVSAHWKDEYKDFRKLHSIKLIFSIFKGIWNVNDKIEKSVKRLPAQFQFILRNIIKVPLSFVIYNVTFLFEAILCLLLIGIINCKLKLKPTLPRNLPTHVKCNYSELNLALIFNFTVQLNKCFNQSP